MPQLGVISVGVLPHLMGCRYNLPIATKLLLGAMVAIPGACVAISRRLELLSSKRPLLADRRSRRNRLIVDVLLCYLIPIIYMALRMSGSLLLCYAALLTPLQRSRYPESPV